MNYEVVFFDGYWWIIAKFPGGKFARWGQFGTEREARKEMDSWTAKRGPSPTLAELERQWILDNGWSGKQ